MRVLYWTELYHPYVGGVEVLASRLLPALEARGFEFQVVTGHGALALPDVSIHHGIKINRLPFQSALETRSLQQITQIRQRIARIKSDFRPDLIHINLSDPSVFFHLQTYRAWGAPTLVSLVTSIPTRYAAPQSLLGDALRQANWITANSRAVLEEVEEFLPGTCAHSSVLYPALEPTKLSPAPLVFESPSLLCIGRVVPEKGFDIAVDAMPRILAGFPKTRLFIAGDGPARAALQQRASALGIASAVDFLGWIQPARIPDLINRATIVIIPSRWKEAFGLVALQAAQMSRPVIATRTGGLPEVVIDGETGILVESENSLALGDAVLTLLSQPGRAIRLGAAAHGRVESLFAWDDYVLAHQELYKKLVRENQAHGLEPALATE